MIVPSKGVCEFQSEKFASQAVDELQFISVCTLFQLRKQDEVNTVNE